LAYNIGGTDNVSCVQSDEVSVFEDSVSHQLSRILYSENHNVVISSASLVIINCQYSWIRNWSHIFTYLAVVLLLGALIKKPKAPPFQIGSGWNFAGFFSK